MRTVLTRLDRIFEQGFTAFQEGETRESNPYNEDQADRQAWFDGWDHGVICGKGCK